MKLTKDQAEAMADAAALRVGVRYAIICHTGRSGHPEGDIAARDEFRVLPEGELAGALYAGSPWTLYGLSDHGTPYLGDLQGAK